MKLLLATLITVFSLVSTTSNATEKPATTGNPEVSAAVLASFNASFKNASEVNWKATASNMFKADFSMSGQYVTAYYDATANLVAVTRNIPSTQLPVTLQATLKASYEEYWISDLFQLSDDNGTSYYVTVEDGDHTITLKSSGT